jgi:putative heme-binding domain-containing protein
VKAVPELIKLLQSDVLHHRRAAAEALGRMGQRAAVEPILSAAATPHDRVLEHSLIYALIEIADPSATAAGLQSASAHTRRAALIALDQMPGGNLNPLDVAALLSHSDPRIKDTAAWIVQRHADWGDALGSCFREHLVATDVDEADRSDLERLLARLARAESVQQLLAKCLEDASLPHAARRTALRAMAQAGLREVPTPWASAVAQILANGDVELVHEAVLAARTLTVRDEDGAALAKGLLAVACNAHQPDELRLAALAAIPGGLVEVDADVFDFLRANLSPDQAIGSRMAAADVLSHAKLTSAQLVALCEGIKMVGPLEANRIVEAYAECTDVEIGQRLVAALEASTARRGLHVEMLKTVLSKFPAVVRERAEMLYAKMNEDASHERERLDALLASLHEGDIRRGQRVFHSTKAACAACHAIGYMGGNSGPDLTRIGQIRAERDLLEAIVFPNASFARSYEPVSVVTAQGRIFNGVVRHDAADEIVLATGPKEEVRIAREDVEGIHPSQVSIMPSGLEQQLSTQELADLVTFLKACK